MSAPEKRVRTTSAMSTFLTCRRKYELRTVHRLRTKTPPAWSRWGKAFHRFVEAYHGGLSAEEAIGQAREVFFADALVEVLTETWEDIVSIALQYAERYPVEYRADASNATYVREIETGLKFNPNLLEIPFRVPIFTPKGRKSAHAVYEGVFDGIVEDQLGDLWVWETKTAANLTDAFFDKLGFDRQTLRYVLAARQIFGPRLKGVLYNAIAKTPARTPTRRQDGSLSTAAVVTTAICFRETLAECRNQLCSEAGTPEEVALRMGICEAAAYLAHVIDQDTTSAWSFLLQRADKEPGKQREAALKRIEKAKADQAKYRELLETAEKRMFFARRFKAVDDTELEEIEWELYQLDRDIHLAEQDGRFFPNDRACDQMGGCEYRPFCLKGDTGQYEEAPKAHAELPEDGFLSPNNPRPVRSKLAAVTDLLVDAERFDLD